MQGVDTNAEIVENARCGREDVDYYAPLNVIEGVASAHVAQSPHHVQDHVMEAHFIDQAQHVCLHPSLPATKFCFKTHVMKAHCLNQAHHVSWQPCTFSIPPLLRAITVDKQRSRNNIAALKKGMLPFCSTAWPVKR